MNYLKEIHNQTILVQSTNQTAPHLETELEIIEQLLNNNNKVFWLQCKEDLDICYYNPQNKKMRCKVCISKVSNGKNVILKNNKNTENLEIINYSNFVTKKDYQNLFSNENFENINALKNFFYKKYDLGMAAASSLVSYTRDHIPNLNIHSNFVKRALTTGAFSYDSSVKIIQKIQPNLVILFNGRFIENRPLLRAAQHLKIDYATHEKGGRLHTYLFRKNSIPHAIDAINSEIERLWRNANEEKYKIGKDFFEKKTKGVEDAWFSFTKEQKQGLLPKSIYENKNKKIVTIFNSSLDEYEGLEGFGPYFYKDDNEGIKQICQDLKDNKDIKLYLRIHPNLKNLNNSQMQFIKDEIAKNSSVEIIAPEDVIDSYALIKASDIIIVFGSTIGIEAAFLNKKVLLLGRAAYENLNCCIIPKNHEETLSIITNSNYPTEPVNTENAIKYGYWNETFGINHKLYNPVGFNKGKYRGKYIKANFLWRKLKQIFK